MVDPDQAEIDEIVDDLETSFENDQAVRVEARDPMMLWDTESDGECAMLDQNDNGTWHPRATVVPIERIAEMIFRDDGRERDVEIHEFDIPDLPAGRHPDHDTDFKL